MADISAELTSELTRIIECPYPPSLSNLSDLLARVDVPTIRSCVQDRSPCAVRKLGRIVHDALSLNAYTLRVLHLLCHAPEFRDELLVLEPSLLPSLLKRANSSKSEFEHLAELCALLLSRPLPEAIPLPAVAQNFFLNVFENATQQPNYETLKSVYHLRQRFDTELCNILRSPKVADSSLLFLWAEGIVLITEHPVGVDGLQNPPGDEEPTSTERLRQHWATPSGQKLFGSTSYLYKTIELTCLNVVWILRGGIKENEAIEGLRIASRAMQFIGQDVKDNWPQVQKKYAMLYEKCASKIQNSSASLSVQLEALSFFGILSGSQSLPQGIVIRYEACILEAPRVAEPEGFAELLAVSLPIYAVQMQESTVAALLSGILSACASQPDSRETSNSIDTIDELATAAMANAALRTTVLRALSSRALQEKIQNLIRTGMTKEGPGCCTHAALFRRQLIAATIASLLIIVLMAQPGESTIPHTLVAALIKKQRDLPPALDTCSHSSKSPTQPSISLFQEASTQYTGQHLQDWRKRLELELQSQNKHQRDAVVRSMAQICSDLETRCNTVEEPLRVETEKSAKLQEQVAHLNEKIAHLNEQTDFLHKDREESVEYVEGLEKELQDSIDEQKRLEQEKSDLLEEKGRMYSKIQEVETSLEVSERNATEALKAAHESSSVKEHELCSTIRQYEEDKRVRDEQVEELHGTISQLQASQMQHETDYRSLTAQFEEQQKRSREAEDTLERERANTARQAEKIAQLETQASEYQQDLEAKEAELEDAIRQLHIARTSYQEFKESSAETTRELAVKHANDLEAITMKAEERYETLEARLLDAQRNAQEERHDHGKTRNNLQHLQASVPPLEARIQELEEFCREQEEELEEFRTARKMMAMHLLPAKPASRTYKEIAQPQTTREPRTHRRRKSAINTQEDVSVATVNAQVLPNRALGNSTNASFASSADSNSSQGNGPAPKRAKPRPAFKVPTMQTPNNQKPSIASKSLSHSHQLSPTKRSALRPVSPNRRHTTVGFTLPGGEEEDAATEIESVRKRRGSLQDIEQVDFDIDDDFTTGTPLTPGFMSGTGRIPDEGDETMTEL
ncbi:uncharacterized protein J4E84_003016 [Alternaria hordeiaustralica]|uniref:uncharacterized protein n=1 Tax=Alternaria hordeiaustralica TaxID=1187925 RepID=UPI0020C49D8F|nr:uncharacterized protein J4E84_003016 [Alternaria hordeiaustralica]KAI4692048.1 hypothetical protein J4E84_003016 [Alternaria hordeiaustralica]